MAIPMGLKSVDDERRLLKWIFGVGIALITIFLAITNVTGAWVETKSWAFSGLALGAEIALVAAFSLIILGETRWRQAVGAIVFIGLAWFCVENGKAAVKHWMKDVFIDAPDALRSRADLADLEATKLDSLPTDTKSEATETRAADREELAALRVELDLMVSSTRIPEAQTRLKALGLYTGPIDGIRAELTEAAMLARGEAVRNRMAILQAKLDAGGGQVDAVAALAPAQGKREEAITLRTQADEAGFREVWAQILLLVAEAARSFGVWAFLMAGTRESAKYGRRHDDIVEAAEKTQPEASPTDNAAEETQSEDKAVVDDVSIDEAIDTAVNDDEAPAPPKPQVGDPWKGGISAGMNHEINNMDDSLPIDEKGVAA